MLSLRFRRCPPNISDSLGEGLSVRHLTAGLVGLTGLADGGVEARPLLGFVLGLEEVADGAEAAGETVAAAGLVTCCVGAARRRRVRQACLPVRQVVQLGQQDVGCAEVFFSQHSMQLGRDGV